MVNTTKTPVLRDENGELLGYIVRDTTSWQAQTIFGYTIARATTDTEARQVLLDQGAHFLHGLWSYYDKDDQSWQPCVIAQATDRHVTVIRTNELGYQDQASYKRTIISSPTDTVLIKAQ